MNECLYCGKKTFEPKPGDKLCSDCARTLSDNVLGVIDEVNAVMAIIESVEDDLNCRNKPMIKSRLLAYLLTKNEDIPRILTDIKIKKEEQNEPNDLR